VRLFQYLTIYSPIVGHSHKLGNTKNGWEEGLKRAYQHRDSFRKVRHISGPLHKEREGPKSRSGEDIVEGSPLLGKGGGRNSCGKDHCGSYFF